MISPLRFIFINDDQETVTCILPTQYTIFSVNPFSLKYSKDNFGFSLGSAATCLGYRFLAFSGLPADPEFDTRQVCIFDHDKKDLKEKENPIIFRQKYEMHILSMRITPELLIVAFHQHIEIWDIKSNQPLQQLPTALNVHAPCDITSDYKLLAVAGGDIYSVSLCLLDDRKARSLRAADDTVSLVKFSHKPGLLAATSADGKIVRVFETSSPNFGCIGKFKRGNTASVIHSIDFSPNNNFLVIVSQNGTLHFFDLRNKPPSASPPTVRSSHKISLGQQAISYILWQTPSQIIVLTMDGQMMCISIDENNCHEVGREHILFMRRLCDDIVVQA
ncbi:hypothetical protein TRFO_28308 [Tritrichomonas foetus]|uniref:Uncharacterized protein n=1 Tax=Tritrichomonas foetus TaxID=1144522 RepID=A0A1J4K0I3_9EUKA|nr:hypothetical protein TRFO_28308 [Tritrichomonas foetus]|eukprot:OHT04256.1 hypothetical protein TRFO_28308 [Tritrichomonas foetus]